MLETLAHLNFPRYRVVVTVDSISHRIHCFKYTPTRCDFEVFDDQESAENYILEPLPGIMYQLQVHDDLGNPETDSD